LLEIPLKMPIALPSKNRNRDNPTQLGSIQKGGNGQRSKRPKDAEWATAHAVKP
jgi:hypothetical protein